MSRTIELEDEELFLVYQMLRGQQEDPKFEKAPTIIQTGINNLVYKLSDPVEEMIKSRNDEEIFEWWEKQAK